MLSAKAVLTESEMSCPSGQPDMQDAHIFGVISGTPAQPRVAYLKKKAQVSAEMLAGLGDVDPTQVFRYAAKCESGRCARLQRPFSYWAQRPLSHFAA